MTGTTSSQSRSAKVGAPFQRTFGSTGPEQGCDAFRIPKELVAGPAAGVMLGNHDGIRCSVGKPAADVGPARHCDHVYCVARIVDRSGGWVRLIRRIRMINVIRRRVARTLVQTNVKNWVNDTVDNGLGILDALAEINKRHECGKIRAIPSETWQADSDLRDRGIAFSGGVRCAAMQNSGLPTRLVSFGWRNACVGPPRGRAGPPAKATLAKKPRCPRPRSTRRATTRFVVAANALCISIPRCCPHFPFLVFNVTN